MFDSEKFFKEIDDDAKSFVKNLAEESYVLWGEIEYEGDGMYSIKDGCSNDGKTYRMSYKEIFESSYDTAMYLLRNFKETGNVNSYFVEWAKEVVALDLIQAKRITDEADEPIGDYVIQRAVFGKQKYA